MRWGCALLLLGSVQVVNAACTELASYACAEHDGALCIVIGAPWEARCDTLAEAQSYCEGRKLYQPGAFESCVTRSFDDLSSVYLSVQTSSANYDAGTVWVFAEQDPRPPAAVTALDCGSPPAPNGDPALHAIALEAYETRCAVVGRDESVQHAEDCDQPTQCSASPTACAQIEALKLLRCEARDASAVERQALQRIESWLAAGVRSSEQLAATYQQQAQAVADAIAQYACTEEPCEGPGAGAIVEAVDGAAEGISTELELLQLQVGSLHDALVDASEREREDLHNALSLDGLPDAPAEGQGSDGWAPVGSFTGFDVSGWGWSRACPMPTSFGPHEWSSTGRAMTCDVGAAVAALFVALAALWCLAIVLRG